MKVVSVSGEIAEAMRAGQSIRFVDSAGRMCAEGDTATRPHRFVRFAEGTLSASDARLRFREMTDGAEGPPDIEVMNWGPATAS